MSAGEPGATEQAERILPEDPSAWSSGEVLRLLLTPAIIAMLFVGGIHWIKLRLPASRTGLDEAPTVQVHLLTHPAPAPPPAEETSRPATASVAVQTDVSVDRPDRPAEVMTATPATPDLLPAKAALPDHAARPPPDAPSIAAAVSFQQLLIQHVARYQRYPRAARPARLYGSVSVSTMFSMRRDGAVLGVWITRSSGQKIFDKEAVDTIWRAQPLPAVPPGLPSPLVVDDTFVFDPP
jgi:periplasmic protein TonB